MKRTSLRKISPRRKARKAAEKAAGAWEHMNAVKGLPCVACGAAPPSQAHHCICDGMARSDFAVIPLCFFCHQGPNGIHAAKRSWVACHGPDYAFLEVVAKMLDV